MTYDNITWKRRAVMAFYLNKSNDSFFDVLNSKIYIDKTTLIKETNEVIRTNNKFMCVTRLRRFGKTMTLSMLNAYYSKGCDSKDIFDKFEISKEPSYPSHLNKHNVIWIDVAEIYTGLKDKNDFSNKLRANLFRDFSRIFPNVDLTGLNIGEAITEINSLTGQRFFFLIDECDVIFREEPGSPLCDEYIMFLKNLFKSSAASSCIDLVYTTGILPIKRYSTESALNMFEEYNMLDSQCLSEYFGFTEKETKELCLAHGIDFP